MGGQIVEKTKGGNEKHKKRVSVKGGKIENPSERRTISDRTRMKLKPD